MSPLFSFLFDHKKAVVAVVLVAAFSPLWLNWVIGISDYHFFKIMYPDWDSFCWHRIDLDNYDESSLEIAINAIKTKYPDISIPENAVRFGFEHSDMFIMELIPEDQKWSVVIDALREDGIDAKYFGQACA